MNKILIPTDFSLTSEKAYKIALTFASNTGAELVFIHIVPREKRKRLSVNFSAVANISEYDVNDEIILIKTFNISHPSIQFNNGQSSSMNFLSSSRKKMELSIILILYLAQFGSDPRLSIHGFFYCTDP